MDFRTLTLDQIRAFFDSEKITTFRNHEICVPTQSSVFFENFASQHAEGSNPRYRSGFPHLGSGRFGTPSSSKTTRRACTGPRGGGWSPRTYPRIRHARIRRARMGGGGKGGKGGGKGGNGGGRVRKGGERKRGGGGATKGKTSRPNRSLKRLVWKGDSGKIGLDMLVSLGRKLQW